MKQKIGLFYWPIFYAEIETSYAGKPFKCFFKTGEGIPFPIWPTETFQISVQTSISMK